MHDLGHSRVCVMPDGRVRIHCYVGCVSDHELRKARVRKSNHSVGGAADPTMQWASTDSYSTGSVRSLLSYDSESPDRKSTGLLHGPPFKY